MKILPISSRNVHDYFFFLAIDLSTRDFKGEIWRPTPAMPRQLAIWVRMKNFPLGLSFFKAYKPAFYTTIKRNISEVQFFVGSFQFPMWAFLSATRKLCSMRKDINSYCKTTPSHFSFAILRPLFFCRCCCCCYDEKLKTSSLSGSDKVDESTQNEPL